MLLSCKGRAGLVVNVTTIIPQTDKAFRVSLAIKLRVLDRLLNIDARLSWVVNCAHLTLCAAAHASESSCDGACGGEEFPKNSSGPSTVLSDRQSAPSLLSNHRETLVPSPSLILANSNGTIRSDAYPYQDGLAHRYGKSDRWASPGFPVDIVGVDELHAAFLNESRTRGRWWRPVAGNPGRPDFERAKSFVLSR